MHEDGITSDKPYRKCANTVGSVLGRYHPHGDAAVYDAMVRPSSRFLNEIHVNRWTRKLRFN